MEEFLKVINPLAFKLKKLGTEKGRISKFTITLNDLQYNLSNWRDELSGKDKSATRSEYEPTVAQLQARTLATYTVNKAKKGGADKNLDRYRALKGAEICTRKNDEQKH